MLNLKKFKKSSKFDNCCTSIVRCEGSIFTYHVVNQVKVADGFINNANYIIQFNDEEH